MQFAVAFTLRFCRRVPVSGTTRILTLSKLATNCVEELRFQEREKGNNTRRKVESLLPLFDALHGSSEGSEVSLGYFVQREAEHFTFCNWGRNMSE